MKATILIVEDEDLLRAFLQIAFERRGFTVLTAGNVTDALALAIAHSIDAVLTDFRLPDHNGLKFCRTLHALNNSLDCRVPVWVMTGSPEPRAEEVFEAGALEVFRKPFKPIDICRRIERFLRHGAQGRERSPICVEAQTG